MTAEPRDARAALRFARAEPPREFYLANRTPPNSVHSETALLGSVLLDPEGVWPLIADWPEDRWYLGKHRLVFQAIRLVVLRHGAKFVDLVSVNQALADAGRLDDVGTAYLMGLSDTTPTSANAETYAAVVTEKHVLRRMIDANARIMQRCYEEQDALEDILDEAARIGGSVETGRTTLRSSDDVDDEALALVTRWRDQGGNQDVLATGLYDLDDKIIGLEKGSLNILAARPSMGKTAMALGIANAAAVRGQHVLVVSLEMPSTQIVLRQLAALAKVDLEKIRTGKMSDTEFERLQSAHARRRGLAMTYEDDPSLTIDRLEREVRALRAAHPLGLVIVDYLGLLNVPGVDDDTARTTRISRALKVLAMTHEVPVLALSQLSRAVESRPNKRPMLSDLRNSGAVEQDADLVMFLYRDEYYHPDTDQQGIAEVIIGKQRNGPIGTVKLGYNASRVSFYNLSQQGAL